MSIYGFSFHYPDPKRAPAALREQYKAAKFTAGENLFFQWWRDKLPEHFKPSAMSKYGYEKRTEKYMERKWKKMSHHDPLVWTGETRDKMLRTFPKPIIQKGEMRLVFWGLKKGFFVTETRFRDRDGNVKLGRKQPPKRYEVVRVAKGEARSMAAQFKRNIKAKIKELRGA